VFALRNSLRHRFVFITASCAFVEGYYALKISVPFYFT